MRPAAKALGVMTVMFGLLTATGCGEDPKAKIAMLEEQNQALTAEKERLRNELDSTKQGRDGAEANLLSLQQDNDDLRRQLASKAQTGPTGDWQSVPGGSMIALEGSVLFDSGKVDLKSSSKTLLSKLTSDIRTQHSGKDVYVFGHTDNEPIKKSGFKDNRELSSERANAVVRYLQSEGISGDHLVACGWGEYKPLTGNETGDGKSKNRRVVIFVSDSSVAAK